ncbi:MAG: LCP family protein [Clostridium sp.]|nr:LCP family protein [Clostridium sp.]MCM1547872.1 LCP family protein [Ruminococcus sp.]
MKKKKKSGSIAIPFLLTFLISLIVIGGIAMVIYDKIDSDNSSLLTMTYEAGSLSDSNSHTILLTLDLSDSSAVKSKKDESSEKEESEENTDEDDADDETFDWEESDEETEKKSDPKPYTFIIMRSMPVHKQIVFIGLPENMHAGENNKALTDIYETGGGAELKTALEYSMQFPVDRYMTFDSDSFQKLCDILGGVNFAVPGSIEGFKKTDGLQYLSPDQIEKVITYGGFGGGEIQRISTASSLISSMINQTNGVRIADNLDNTFETLVNSTETDISALDYQQEKYAVKFLMKNTEPGDSEKTSDRAKFLTPSGMQTSDTFIIDSSFLDEIAKYFVEQATEPPQDTTLKPMIPETEAGNYDE